MIYQINLNDIELITLTFQNPVSIQQIIDKIIEIYQYPKEAVSRIEIDGITQSGQYILNSQPKIPIKANFQFKTKIGFFNKLYKTFYLNVDLCEPIKKISIDIRDLILPKDYSVNIVQSNNLIYLNSYEEIPQQLEFNVEANFYINFKEIQHNFKINPFEMIKDIKLMISQLLKIEIEFTLFYNNVLLNEQDQYLDYHIPDYSKINIDLQNRIKIFLKYNNIVHQHSILSNQKLGEFKCRIRKIYNIPINQEYQLLFQNNPLENNQECISNIFSADGSHIILKLTKKTIQLTLQDLNSQEKFNCQVQSIDLVSSLTKQSFFLNKQVIFYYNKQNLIMTQRFEQIQFNSDNFIINYHIIDEGQEINQFYIYFSCKIDQTIYFKKFSEENTIYDAKCIFSQSLQKQKTSISIFSQDTQLKDDQLIIHFKQQELFIYETKLISFHTRNGQVLKQKVYKACMKVKEMKNDFQREISQQSCKYEFNQSPIDDEDKLLSDITDQTEIVLDVDFQHNLKLINNELKTQQFNVQFYQTEIVSSIFSKFLKGNLQYYYNGQLIDINKSFEDNLIQNNSCVYYGKIYNFTFKFTNNNQIIKIQVKSLNTKIEDAVQPILKENHPQNFQFSCNNRLINLEKTFSQEKIKEGVIQIELKSLIVNIYDKNKIYKYHVLPNLTIEKLNKLINNNQNKWLFKLDNDDILQDNIELSTLKNSNGEVELIYKEYIKQNTILHQYQDDVSIDFFVTQNIKTIENSSLVIPIEWNDQKFFETVKLDQKVEEFLEDFKKQKKLSKIFFFQDGEIIDINKKFEDLRDIEYSFFEIISE